MAAPLLLSDWIWPPGPTTARPLLLAGQEARLYLRALAEDGSPGAATGIRAELRRPDGTIQVIEGAGVVAGTEAGTWYAAFQADQPGPWRYEWIATGPAEARSGGGFRVQSASVQPPGPDAPILTTEDLDPIATEGGGILRAVRIPALPAATDATAVDLAGAEGGEARRVPWAVLAAGAEAAAEVAALAVVGGAVDSAVAAAVPAAVTAAVGPAVDLAIPDYFAESRPAGQVLATPASAEGGAAFRGLVETDLPAHGHDASDIDGLPVASGGSIAYAPSATTGTTPVRLTQDGAAASAANLPVVAAGEQRHFRAFVEWVSAGGEKTAILSLSRESGLATLTTTNPERFAVGQFLTLAGLQGGMQWPSLNNTWVVTEVTSDGVVLDIGAIGGKVTAPADTIANATVALDTSGQRALWNESFSVIGPRGSEPARIARGGGAGLPPLIRDAGAIGASISITADTAVNTFTLMVSGVGGGGIARAWITEGDITAVRLDLPGFPNARAVVLADGKTVVFHGAPSQDGMPPPGVDHGPAMTMAARVALDTLGAGVRLLLPDSYRLETRAIIPYGVYPDGVVPRYSRYPERGQPEWLLRTPCIWSSPTGGLDLYNPCGRITAASTELVFPAETGAIPGKLWPDALQEAMMDRQATMHLNGTFIRYLGTAAQEHVFTDLSLFGFDVGFAANEGTRYAFDGLVLDCQNGLRLRNSGGNLFIRRLIGRSALNDGVSLAFVTAPVKAVERRPHPDGGGRADRIAIKIGSVVSPNDWMEWARGRGLTADPEEPGYTTKENGFLRYFKVRVGVRGTVGTLDLSGGGGSFDEALAVPGRILRIAGITGSADQQAFNGDWIISEVVGTTILRFAMTTTTTAAVVPFGAGGEISFSTEIAGTEFTTPVPLPASGTGNVLSRPAMPGRAYRQPPGTSGVTAYLGDYPPIHTAGRKVNGEAELLYDTEWYGAGVVAPAWSIPKHTFGGQTIGFLKPDHVLLSDVDPSDAWTGYEGTTSPTEGGDTPWPRASDVEALNLNSAAIKALPQAVQEDLYFLRYAGEGLNMAHRGASRVLAIQDIEHVSDEGRGSFWLVLNWPYVDELAAAWAGKRIAINPTMRMGIMIEAFDSDAVTLIAALGRANRCDGYVACTAFSADKANSENPGPGGINFDAGSVTWMVGQQGRRFRLAGVKNKSRGTWLVSAPNTGPRAGASVEGLVRGFTRLAIVFARGQLEGSLQFDGNAKVKVRPTAGSLVLDSQGDTIEIIGDDPANRAVSWWGSIAVPKKRGRQFVIAGANGLVVEGAASGATEWAAGVAYEVGAIVNHTRVITPATAPDADDGEADAEEAAQVARSRYRCTVAGTSLTEGVGPQHDDGEQRERLPAPTPEDPYGPEATTGPVWLYLDDYADGYPVLNVDATSIVSMTLQQLDAKAVAGLTEAGTLYRRDTDGALCIVPAGSAAGVRVLTEASYPVPVQGFIAGLVPAAPANLLAYRLPRALTLPAAGVGSGAAARRVATAEAVLQVLQNNTEVGTITIPAASGVGTIAVPAAVALAKNDWLRVVGPAVADATLADLGIWLTLEATA